MRNVCAHCAFLFPELRTRAGLTDSPTHGQTGGQAKHVMRPMGLPHKRVLVENRVSPKENSSCRSACAAICCCWCCRRHPIAQYVSASFHRSKRHNQPRQGVTTTTGDHEVSDVSTTEQLTQTNRQTNRQTIALWLRHCSHATFYDCRRFYRPLLDAFTSKLHYLHLLWISRTTNRTLYECMLIRN